MATSSELPVASGRSHTAVKHELLVRYLDAWTPTVLHSGHRVTYAEGYACAGVHPGREDGSPGAALRVFGEFADRLAGHELAMVLVDEDPTALADRLTALRAEVGAPPELTVHTVAGTCADDLIPALTSTDALASPVLAYLDAAHGPPPPFDVIAALTRHRSSEVMVALDPGLLTRMAADVGDRVFGGAAWRHAEGYASLVTCYRDALRRAGLAAVVHVELVDEHGDAELLFFGSRSEKHLDKFKTELWAVDEYAGVRYRDPRDPDAELLDISLSPPIAPLRRAVLDTVAAHGSRTVADLRRHALAETLYRTSDATHALSALLSSGALARDPENGRLTADTVLRRAAP